MYNSVLTTIFTDNRGEIDVRILAEHQDNTIDFNTAQVYSIWDCSGNPLGMFVRRLDDLGYHGYDLDVSEQQQVADFIKAYREDEWDL